MILDLYEAAIPKNPGGRLSEVLMRWEPGVGWDKHPVNKQREHALRLVGDEVGKMVKDECYPQVYRTVHEARKETQGFIYDFGFHSLLGAMYLQMMLLITDAEKLRVCQRPGCQTIIPSSDRKDKVFCGRPACKQWWSDNYGDSKKARAARKRRQS